MLVLFYLIKWFSKQLQHSNINDNIIIIITIIIIIIILFIY